MDIFSEQKDNVTVSFSTMNGQRLKSWPQDKMPPAMDKQTNGWTAVITQIIALGR